MRAPQLKLFGDRNKDRNKASALPTDFDPEFYLTANPDIAIAGIDPAQHYLRCGKAEGRRYKAISISAPEIAALLPEGFDPDYYLRANPDVADVGADPIEHYLKSGKTEKRSFCSRIPKDLDPKKASLLPVDFDPVFYAEANPDIVEVGLDPIDHYIQFGRNEGRHYRLGFFSIDYNRELDPQKKTVLVVGHEASRTGAPVLCLKIVEGLARDYNVIAYLMKGGALLPDFKMSANVTLELSQRTPADCAGALEALVSEVAVDYAIVNSAVSYSILPTLTTQAIPSVTLLHEFTSYIYPRSIMLSILRWSTLNVFSSDIIRDDAMHRLPAWSASPTSHILPQGRCIVDGNPGSEIVDRAFRPEGWPQDTRVIIGAGTFEFRKGVDLFLQTAAQILKRSQNKNIRFVWFGKGYKPDGDMSFSVFIEEQVKRSGLQEHFEVIDEVGSLEYAYAQSDLLILSSRLDPLPNLASTRSVTACLSCAFREPQALPKYWSRARSDRPWCPHTPIRRTWPTRPCTS